MNPWDQEPPEDPEHPFASDHYDDAESFTGEEDR